MARDVMAKVMVKLGRARQPIRDADDPLPVTPGVDSLESRVTHMVEHEFARRLEDVLRRRTTFWMKPDRGRVVAGEVASIMAKRLGWPPARVSEEMQSYESALWDEELLLQRSKETP
jgi:glycerol-3-phosphate dehydrogenase